MGKYYYHTHRRMTRLTPWLIASAYLIILLPPSSVKPSAPNCQGMILSEHR